MTASENVAQQWIKSTCTVPVGSMISLIDQMIDLLQETTDYLAEVLAVFIAEIILVETSERKSIGKVLAPELERKPAVLDGNAAPRWLDEARLVAAVHLS